MPDSFGYFRIGYSGLIELLLCPPSFEGIPYSPYTIRTKHGCDIATYIKPCSNPPEKSSLVSNYEELSFHEDIIVLLAPATEEELRAHSDQKKQIPYYLEQSNERIKKMNLAMTMVNAYPFFTKEKIIFNFISNEKKIDFRNLAKELGQSFRMKIELHKIYHRDFAAFLGGIGYCGKSLCCSECKTNKGRITTLDNNTAAPTSICGKTRCCWNFER